MELVNKIYKELNCKHEITKKFITSLLQSIKRFDDKQDIYTLENVSSTNLSGVYVRANKKLNKIRKYLEEDQNEIDLSEEKIKKYLLDISINSIIGYLLINDEWE